GDLFDRETAVRMLGHLQSLLDAVGRDPDQRLSGLPLLTANERRRLLHEWNATKADYPQCCLHELFAEQAAGRPDAVAVECGEERLTYRELDGRANQLGRELHVLGAGPGALVGICAERSLDLVV